MLDTDTKRRIDTARDILVGKVPDPKSQVEQITIALIYKFMDDMDAESEEFGGKRKFFAGEFARYGWPKLMRSGLGGLETLNLYAEAIAKMPENPGIPPLFRDIFKNAYLPYRDPETLKMFLKVIDEFAYDHSERLGDAFEYLLSVLGSQGDAGQFRTPRHIIDFMVEIIDPKKTETVLDPACGTAGFLISSWKHILRNNSSKPSPSAALLPLPLGEGRREEGAQHGRGSGHYRGGFDFSGLKKRVRELRQTQTDAEMLLWDLLRDRQLGGAKFRRQHQFGNYICDFFCDAAKLAVECDGSAHDTPDRQSVDQKRDTYLRSQGLTVLRFRNDRVLDDTDAVLTEIAACLPSHPEQEAAPLPSTAGRGAGGEGVGRMGDLLTPDEKGRLAQNFKGYDISPDMVRLSLVNMYLHGFADPHIHEYDTLTSQDRWNEYADVILANPPFMSPKGGIKPHNRFSVQSKRSEVLFVDYMAEHLTPGGRAGIIVPEGIIFQSQNAYTQLRKMLVEEDLVAVVSLPAGVFNPYSGVKTSILILDKSLAKRANTIAFFKIENDGFGLGAQRREIDKNDLPQAQAEIGEYLRRLRAGESVADYQPTLGLIVAKEKIAANGDYNLSVERYREGVANLSTFPLVRLEEVFMKIGNGVNVTQVDEKAKYRVSRIQTIADGSVNLEKTKFTNDEVKAESFLKLGDILLSHINSFDHLGKSAIFLEKDVDVIHGINLIRLEPDDLRIDPHYAIRIFKTDRFIDTVKSFAQKAVNQASVKTSDLRGIQIPLPPLEVQKEIVAEIEGYQKIINGARAVFDHYRPHIPIQPDWPSEQLGKLCSIRTGKKDVNSGNPEGKYPFFTCAREHTFSDIWSFDCEAILVAGNGDVGAVQYYQGKFEAYQRTYVLSDWVNVSGRYLYFYLDGRLKETVSKQKQGNTMPYIKLGMLSEFQVALPPLATQQAIVAEIQAEQSLVAANRELIARFEKKIQATLARIWGENESTPEEA